MPDGKSLKAPFPELDNDTDGYVECEFFEETWEGSLSVDGGLDCDDEDVSVYPSATEVCDGKYNDCTNNYDENSAPADELDDDGDGWVECTRDLDDPWNPYDPNYQEPNQPGYGFANSDLSTYCICEDDGCQNNCRDQDGLYCSPQSCDYVVSTTLRDCDDNDQYTHPFAAEDEYNDGDQKYRAQCMRDFDQDGYGDSNLDSSIYPSDFVLGHDCNDERQYIHPRQNEVCEGFNEEQIDTDCDGDVNTAASLPWIVENPLQNYMLITMVMVLGSNCFKYICL